MKYQQTSCIYNDHAEENSLEHVLVSEVYPLKQLVMDQAGLVVPFTPLCGECVEYLGRTSDGAIALSNYRLFIESFVNIPIGLIESVEYRDIFYLHIYSKDARTVRLVEWMLNRMPIGMLTQLDIYLAFVLLVY